MTTAPTYGRKNAAIRRIVRPLRSGETGGRSDAPPRMKRPPPPPRKVIDASLVRPAYQAAAVLSSTTPTDSSQRSASIAALQPSPAAVTAWR